MAYTSCICHHHVSVCLSVCLSVYHKSSSTKMAKPTMTKTTPYDSQGNLRNCVRYGYSYYRTLIGNRTCSIEWFYFQWPSISVINWWLSSVTSLSHWPSTSVYNTVGATQSVVINSRNLPCSGAFRDILLSFDVRLKLFPFSKFYFRSEAKQRFVVWFLLPTILNSLYAYAISWKFSAEVAKHWMVSVFLIGSSTHNCLS